MILILDFDSSAFSSLVNAGSSPPFLVSAAAKLISSALQDDHFRQFSLFWINELSENM